MGDVWVVNQNRAEECMVPMRVTKTAVQRLAIDRKRAGRGWADVSILSSVLTCEPALFLFSATGSW